MFKVFSKVNVFEFLSFTDEFGGTRNPHIHSQRRRILEAGEGKGEEESKDSGGVGRGGKGEGVTM